MKHEEGNRVLCLIFHSLFHQYICIPSSLACAYDAPKIWNDLPNDVYSATFFLSIRKKMKLNLFAKVFRPGTIHSLTCTHQRCQIVLL